MNYITCAQLQVDKANPLASGRRTKLTAVEDSDKIDKLEKSLEMLDKAIEKNNQSEFNALTDVLETDSNFDFEKDDADEEKNPAQVPDAQDKDKPTRAKLTLPPATTLPKPLANNSNNSSRLGQLNPSKPKPNPRLRSGAGGSVSTLASSNARSSLTSKRRDNDISAKHTAAADAAADKLEALAKTFEYDYEEDSERGVDDEEDGDAKKYGNMDQEDYGTEEEESQNDEYAPYLDTKCELAEMLEMEEEYEDDDDDDDEQSPKPPTQAGLVTNQKNS